MAMIKNVLRCLCMLSFLVLSQFFCLYNVSADGSPYGQIVQGDSVIWDAPYARVEVYPHTARDGIRQAQYCDFTWKKPSASVDLAFIFPVRLNGYKDVYIWKNTSHFVSVPVYSTFSHNYTIKNIISYSVLPVTPLSVDYGDVPSSKYYYVYTRNNSIWRNVTIGFDSFVWLNSSHTGALFTYSYVATTSFTKVERFFFDWVSINDLFSMEQVGSSFYYYFKGVSVVQGKTYNLKWVYDLPVNCHGKWSLMVKLSSDSLPVALNNNRYVMLDPWYNTSWKYSKRVVIDHTKVEVNLYNYPIYFNHSSADFAHAQSDGDDFMFVAIGNTTKYYHQIENFSSNRLIAWVNITTLSSTTDTVLYLYYGNPTCSSQQNNASTWNSTYVMVYHLKDKTTTTVADSTVNARTLTKQSADHPKQMKARADSGEKFALTADYLTTGNKYMPLGCKSVEVWWHCNGSAYKHFFDSNGGGASAKYGLTIYLGTSTNLRFWAVGTKGTSGTANYALTAVGNFSNNKWHYGMHTWDGTVSAGMVKLYCDRIMNTTTALAVESVAATYTDYFGCEAYLKTLQAYGWIDEIRVSNVVRSRGYFNTTKNCINSSASFLSVGSEILQDGVFISTVYPIDASSGQIPRPWLAVSVYDYYGTHRMNLTFGTNLSGSWRVLGRNLTCVNGTYRQYLVNLTMASKKAFWRVNVSDGHGIYVNNTYSFTTGLCNLSSVISETETNCSGTTTASYVPSTGFAITASYLSKLYDYATITNSSGTHQKAYYSALGAFKVWANYTTKLYDYATIVNSSGTHQKAWYPALGAFKTWANYTTKLYDYSTITNASGTHQKAYYSALGAFKTWANYSSKVYDYKNFVNVTGTLQKAWYQALGAFKVWGNVTGNTTAFTYHNNTVNVSSVKQLKLFGSGYHLWDNSSSGVMSYTNIVNATGTLEKAWYPALGKFKVWANYTGNGTGPLGIYLFENLVNATGTHEYATNATGYLVWANYTGTNGSGNVTYIPLNKNSRPTVYLILGTLFGLLVFGIMGDPFRRGKKKI